MTMTFFIHDAIAEFDPRDNEPPQAKANSSLTASAEVRTIEEKMTIPKVQNLMLRDRLNNAVCRSCDRYPATLVCGRSGTGKTALAAACASKNKTRFAWYTIDSADVSWDVFAHYFSACLDAAGVRQKQRIARDTSSGTESEKVSRYLAAKLDVLNSETDTTPFVIVLDDFHNLFDAGWFDDFFVPLLGSLSSNIHLLLLSRTKPPGPIWRLRSKQILNVIDEKLLAFTPNETAKLYENSGLSAALARRAFENSYGRANRVHQLLVNDLISAVS